MRGSFLVGGESNVGLVNFLHYFRIWNFNGSCSTYESGLSDPEKLKETAQDVKRMSPDELKKRQMEIKVRFMFLFLVIFYSDDKSCLWLRGWNLFLQKFAAFIEGSQLHMSCYVFAILRSIYLRMV